MSARILLTEDDPATRSVMRILLQVEGHLVAEAPNGATAIEILKAEDPPDQVMLDLAMPGVDGIDFLMELNAMKPRPASKVVIVTADRTPDLAEDLMQLGAAGFVYKPLRREELKFIVDAALGGKRFAGAH